MDTTQYVMNGTAAALGSAAMLLCLAVQGTAVTLVMTLLKPRVKARATLKENMAAHALFFLAMLILLCSHLAQICIWAFTLSLPGIVGDVHQATLLAGSTYTTVGFANVPLPVRWQLLMVIMAVTGLFAFAWSTSIMYGLSRQLYRSEN